MTGNQRSINPRSMYDIDYVLNVPAAPTLLFYLRSLTREDWRDETGPCEHYVEAPQGLYDFVLIDGSHRKECLHKATKSTVLNPSGMVFHHDAYKDGHQHVIEEFGGGAFLEGSGVGMSPGESYQGLPIPNELWYWSPRTE